MKFFHVYNEDCIKGLEKNGLLNKDSGFKIQHAFSVPEHLKFNKFAAKGSKLYNLIKDGNIPFYVDRISGGITWHNYDFDKNLINEYKELLGDWFLGFQLHESASNRRRGEWPTILRKMGSEGPYDVEELRAKLLLPHKKLEDGTMLCSTSQDSIEYYANKKFVHTHPEFIEEIKEIFQRRLNDTDGNILPCDSYFLATKLQDEMGMKTFMPEVGCQIAQMRQAVSLARGMAKKSKKTWGTYYECWRESREDGKFYYTMPCFNSDPSNEWYLTQDQHADDFTSYGKNGGSSRLLQNRIYYYSLMSGADYFSEEWGLNCSYCDMKDFSLSEYGETKKDFIRTAENLRGIKSLNPFAIVLPKKYSCVEIPDMFIPYEFGQHKDTYLDCNLNSEDKAYFGHIEDVLKLIFVRYGAIYGNEGHTITNSRFGDVFDIIYEDASDETLNRYEYLIDATREGSFIKAKEGSDYKILDSSDLSYLEEKLKDLIKTVMPCYADGLHWLVSYDEKGVRYLSIFNNEGNERSFEKGNTIHSEADKTVNVTFNVPANIEVIKEGYAKADIQRKDDRNYLVTVPAASFVIFSF